MNRILISLGLLFSSFLIVSCSGETQQHTLNTPTLQLKAVGPLFQGSNTATAEWSYSLKDLFPDLEGDINIESAKITAIEVIPVEDVNYPELGTMVMEMKPKNTPMMRVGLLNSQLNTTTTNTLDIAEIQEDLELAFADGMLIFVGDFDLVEEEYFDDLVFNLIVTFEIETSI